MNDPKDSAHLIYADADFAKPGFNRWTIPLAAVLIHICIGSVYAWSTFNRPINAMFTGLSPDSSFKAPYITFSTALVLLGLSAAFGGPWVVRRGPRTASTAAAIFFASGLLLGAVGLKAHSQAMVFAGMGVISGIGCGLGYIAPVSTLVKWFPDRRGMATGMAVMGFGGGAFLGGFLNAFLINHVGVDNALWILAAGYFAVMLVGAQIMRQPVPGWKPEGWVEPKVSRTRLAVEASLTRNQALQTSQFWLVWGILFINVTAGIGILAQASPMMQDMFGKTANQAAFVVSLISIFNATGRLFWASLSDYIGRRATYMIFFISQFVLFLTIPLIGANQWWVMFQLMLFIVFSMYGGGFATVPAFLADLFGPTNVGAIHGALLTAWSAAALVGPYIVTHTSDVSRLQLVHGASPAHIYDFALNVLAGLLAVGFLLTLIVSPLKEKEGSPLITPAGATS